MPPRLFTRVPPPTRLDALTGLRFFAALFVVATHAAYWTGHYTTDFLGYAGARLEIGVTIFFVLSGFLLFRPWVRARFRAGRPAPSGRRYLWHRARRILPAYWLTVLGVYALYRFDTGRDAGIGGHGTEGLVRNLTLTQFFSVGHAHVGLTQMWSLAVEVCFYLLLPALAWLLLRGFADVGRGGLALGFTTLALVTPLWLAWALSAEVDYTARWWLPAFGWWFLAGMALAVLAETLGRLAVMDETMVVAAALAVFLLTCTSVAGEPGIMPAATGPAITKSALYASVGFLLLVPPVLGPGTGWYTRLLASRPLVWLGEISYELFLVHLVVLELVGDLLGYHVFTGSFHTVLLVTVVLSLPLSWALHRVVAPLTRLEIPGGRGGHPSPHS